jgi:histidinol-phosphate aminotransferase
MDHCRSERSNELYRLPMVMSRSSLASMHGGTDSGPPIRLDFSTNAHPLGPNPFVREAVLRADRARYPDPHYTSLRSALGAFHRVQADRIVVGASASELIWRLSRCWIAAGAAAILTDNRTFGEYLRAARAVGAPVAAERSAWPPEIAVLRWCCNPDNPTGAHQDQVCETALAAISAAPVRHDLIVADLAYWPFRAILSLDDGCPAVLHAAWADDVIQLWSPNKLHGLTGVRGAYLVLPANPIPRINAETLTSLAPSWVLGADGVALLRAHVCPDAFGFLRDTAPALRAWKKEQDRRLTEAGWYSESSPMHYGLWRPPVEPSLQPRWHAHLRELGVKLRDATSFDRPGWVRLVSRTPHDVEKLLALTERFRDRDSA